MALVLPCSYSELEQPALSRIVDELSKIDYLEEIIIGLDRADESQFRISKQYFQRLPQNTKILWQDGPGMMSIVEKLDELRLALHDCDIQNYQRDIVSRLLYPTTDPTFGFKF
jgi:glucosyl-3-phosphoglycerate synthase